jgi:Replication-relaxation
MFRGMDIAERSATRRPRFRRTKPPVFRVTDADLVILRLVAQHRFLRSTHIAELVGRSIDRTNDRLCRLFHAGYVDRPKAQLEHYPTNGSAPMVYALADPGTQLLSLHTHSAAGSREWSRVNREAGRPFIDHQLEITDFYTSLQRAAPGRTDVKLIHPDELVAAFPEHTRNARNPFSLRATLPDRNTKHEIGIIPDFAFGLRFADGSRRCFLVEIDRGTMPVTRSNLRQSSFQRKMQTYLAAYAAKQHEIRFEWKAFRVLTVTADDYRMRSIQEALRHLEVPNTPGAALFLFASQEGLRTFDPLAHSWQDGNRNAIRLI